MKELFEMVGLETVKAELINTYKKVLRDMELPPAARIPYTLNFSFLGNPGTGARLPCHSAFCQCPLWSTLLVI